MGGMMAAETKSEIRNSTRIFKFFVALYTSKNQYVTLGDYARHVHNDSRNVHEQHKSDPPYVQLVAEHIVAYRCDYRILQSIVRSAREANSENDHETDDPRGKCREDLEESERPIVALKGGVQLGPNGDKPG
jgi:hypothetical protein